MILSGSLPPGVPADAYKTLIDLAHKSKSRVFVDSGGETLRLALEAKPDFVKPNREEASSWSGRDVDGPPAAASVLEEILHAGAKGGAISLGAQGIVWKAQEEQTLFAKVPAIVSRSAVGSGDSTLAGFAMAEQQGMSPSESLRLAVACGAANCLADLPGRASAADIARMKEQVTVESLH